MNQRKAKIERKTSEVKVKIEINLDGKGEYDIDTGIPFFNHMLAQFARHGYFDLKIKAIGDIDIDFLYMVEVVGLAPVEAILRALGRTSRRLRWGSSTSN